MGIGTVLLVITMLLNSNNDNLPNTSYMKLLDIWFAWHILNVFAVITYHIVIDGVRRYLEKLDEAGVSQLNASDDDNSVKPRGATTKINWINRIVIVVFPFFNGIYFIRILYLYYGL